MLRLHGNMTNEVEQLRAKDHLMGADIIDLATSLGWELADSRLYRRDAFKIAKARILSLVNSTEPRPEALPDDDPSGVYLFARNSSTSSTN